jgi:hypothetical protein
VESFRDIKVRDMPKLECPFVRERIDNQYVVTPEVNEGYEWVFEDNDVMAIEKLHGTNVSIVIIEGQVVEVYNRTERLPFINKGKQYIIEGLLKSKSRGYLEFLGDGQHFGELIGEKVNKNPYKLKGHIWIPFATYARKTLRYKSWGQYPKTFEAISDWFKDTLMPLYSMHVNSDRDGFVEGVVFTHPDGRMAKLRRDMFDWYKGKRH